MEDRAIPSLRKYSKLFGIKSSDFQCLTPDSIQHAIFWAAVDNYDDIEDGTITKFEQLKTKTSFNI